MNTIKVTLTEVEAEKRRALESRRRRNGAHRKEIPQQVLDFLSPRVEVVTYLDEEGNKVGECWRWQSCSERGVPRATLDGRWQNVRRWVLTQMRDVRNLPTGWLTVVDCGTEGCAHPLCCQPTTRSKSGFLWNGEPYRSSSVRLRAATKAGRSCSSMTPQKAQQLRDEFAAQVAAGVLRCEIYVSLGKRFGLTPRSVRNIAHGHRWSPGTEMLAPQRRIASVFDLGRMA